MKANTPLKANTQYYTHRLFGFLDRLAANNNRPWFAEHKGEYEELRGLWLEDLQRLIDALGQSDPRMARLTPKGSAFRIYRDTRFSYDKTPYKTYFSAAFSPYGRDVHSAGYYLHMSSDSDAGLFGGIWQPQPDVLKKLRKAIVDNIEEFEAIVNDKAMNAAFPDWCGEQLKTVPKGYDKSHPLAKYLRLKDIGRFHYTGRDFFLDPAWPEKAAETFLLLKPLNEFIDYSIHEEI